jgi:hypothetical protein
MPANVIRYSLSRCSNSAYVFRSTRYCRGVETAALNSTGSALILFSEGLSPIGPLLLNELWRQALANQQSTDHAFAARRGT